MVVDVGDQGSTKGAAVIRCMFVAASVVATFGCSQQTSGPTPEDRRLTQLADERDAARAKQAERARIRYRLAFPSAPDFTEQVERLGFDGFVPIASTSSVIIFAHRSAVIDFFSELPEERMSSFGMWSLYSDDELDSARARVKANTKR